MADRAPGQLPDADWTRRTDLAALIAALGPGNARYVGGAVRDTLLGAAVADELDYVLEPITGAEQRRMLYLDVLDHLRDSHPKPVRLTREDVLGGLGSTLVAVLAVLPSLAPLLLLRDHYWLALRVSNLISFAVLFYTGYQWGRYSGSNPWKLGLLLFLIGAVLALIAIPLGG